MNPPLLSNQQFIDQLRSIIKANLNNENFGVSYLASEMGTSRSSLYHKVFSITQKSVSQFIREIRITEARKLLDKQTGTVSEIAKRALRKFNECMKYCPKNCCLLLMRGLARYELGDIEGAHEDWDRMLTLGGIELNRETMQEQFSDFKGFAALTDKLNSQENSSR